MLGLGHKGTGRSLQRQCGGLKDVCSLRWGFLVDHVEVEVWKVTGSQGEGRRDERGGSMQSEAVRGHPMWHSFD